MSAVPKKMLTEQEYLTRERKAKSRSEFYRGETFAMAGASVPHGFVKDNFISSLKRALKGSSCRTVSSDVRVKVSSTGLYTYPDIAIVCGEPEVADQHSDILLNPRVIIEVLSPSTENYDRTEKFDQYRFIPSFQEYLLVSQTSAAIEQFVRQKDESWTMFVHRGLKGKLAFKSIPATIRIRDIYENVKLVSQLVRLQRDAKRQSVD